MDNGGNWGARQHQNIMTYVTMTSTVMAAAQYCDSMIYGGYSDWFLPSQTEWRYVNTAFNAGQIPFVYGAYKLSEQHSDYTYGLALEWVSNPVPLITAMIGGPIRSQCVAYVGIIYRCPAPPPM